MRSRRRRSFGSTHSKGRERSFLHPIFAQIASKSPVLRLDMSEFSSSRAHLWPGVPVAFASAILFGASAPFAKLLLGSVDPQLLAGLLYLGAGTGLVVVHVVRGLLGLEAPEAPLQAFGYTWLATVIVFGGGRKALRSPQGPPRSPRRSAVGQQRHRPKATRCASASASGPRVSPKLAKVRDEAHEPASARASEGSASASRRGY